MKPLVSAYRGAAVLLLNTLLLLIALETGAAVALFFMPPVPALPAMASPYFAAQAWGQAYWKEFETLFVSLDYHPYIIWRTRPFEGRLIRVSSVGLRLHPHSQCARGAYRVWVFGGSTVWGLGSPDDQTIPSHLQTALARTRPSVCVVNFGQLGFVSTQGVVQLENELRQSDRPDVVIFYDGVNDTVSGFGYWRAGLHLAYEEIRRRVEAPRLHDTSPRWAELLSWSHLYRLISRRVTKAAQTAPLEPRPDSLVNAVVATYLENVRIVKSLATTYGFRAAFFWQPSLATGGKPLSGVERAIQAAEVTIPFARRVHARFRAQAAHHPDVHDLSNLFDQETSLIYLDWHHTTPEANRTIARAIVEAVSR